MGTRSPDAQWSSSCIRRRPWEDVAGYVRAPTAAAEMHAWSALCSLSTSRNCAGNSPDATISAIRSTIVVCGVIGEAAPTCTRASFAARLCAWFPVIIVSMSLRLHADRAQVALGLADPAALAVLVVDRRPPVSVQDDRHIRADLPAQLAPRALRELDDRAECAPGPCELHGTRRLRPQRLRRHDPTLRPARAARS